MIPATQLILAVVLLVAIGYLLGAVRPVWREWEQASMAAKRRQTDDN